MTERHATLEIGRKLVSLSSARKGLDAVDTLYDEKVVSIEAQGSDALPQRMEGKGPVRGKNAWWYENHEIHSSQARGPFQGHRDDQFAVLFEFDVTFKPDGKRSQMSEIGLYTVSSGKVVQEEFLYGVD